MISAVCTHAYDPQVLDTAAGPFGELPAVRALGSKPLLRDLQQPEPTGLNAVGVESRDESRRWTQTVVPTPTSLAGCVKGAWIFLTNSSHDKRSEAGFKAPLVLLLCLAYLPPVLGVLCRDGHESYPKHGVSTSTRCAVDLEGPCLCLKKRREAVLL